MSSTRLLSWMTREGMLYSSLISRGSKVRMIRAVLVSIGCGFCIGLTAHAEDLKQASQQVIDCKSAPETERLACYDAAADILAAALETAAAAPVVAEAAESNDGGLFPSWMRLSRNDRAEQADEPNSYETTVVGASVDGQGRYYLTTDDGVVWRQTEIERIREISQLPARVEIKKGAMGSLRMKFLDGRKKPYRVSRIR